MKFYNFILLIVGLSIIFQLAGIAIDGDLLSWMGVDLTSAETPFDFIGSGAYIKITLLLIAGIGTGIAVGFLTKANSENYVILPFVTTGTAIFFTTSIGIIDYAWGNYPGWIAYITFFIMSLLTVGFLISLMEWFRGTD